MPPNAERLTALLAPIAADAPAGKDLRYDARYDRLKEARREDLELPPGGLATERKIADWPQTVTLATELLTKDTKDLQVAAWLTEALLKREGLTGFTLGLTTVKGLLDQFWETFYPELDEEDLELRTGPLQWLGSRVDLSVRLVPVANGGITLLDYTASRGIPTEQESQNNREKGEQREEALSGGKRSPEDVDRAVAGTPKAFYKTLVAETTDAQAALNDLEKAADARFGREAPSFTALRNALDELRRISSTILAQKLEADPDPVEPEPEVDANGVGTYAPPDGWAPDAAGPPKSPADAAGRVAAAAKYLRSTDATNPAPYLTLRGLRWGELRAALGSVDPKLLEAPPTALRARLKGLLLDGHWTDLLEQGEALMATPQGRGWLDLQRYTLTACAQLGAPYDAVAAAVRGELRALLAALPRLPEMTLMDDTPTANDETRAWLAAEGLTGATEADAESLDEPADVEVDDGSAALDGALAQEDETGENGGFGRPATRRRRAPSARGTNGMGAAPDAFALARNELAAKRPNRAIELLVAELARERSPRGRFVRQTQIAYVMVEAGLESVARPILDKLVAEIDERGLEQWEAGPLVAQPLALLCRAIDRMQDENAYEQRHELYLRVCRLDPLQAIALQRPA